MEFTLTYASSRKEVMSLYWRLWKDKLWKTHVMTFVGVSCLVFFLVSGSVGTTTRALVSVLAGAACILYYVLHPLIAFKSQQRVLIANANGIKTIIGKKSGEATWDEVKSIESIGTCIHIIRKNLNTFIVPSRAFSSEKEAHEFFEAITAWHARRG